MIRECNMSVQASNDDLMHWKYIRKKKGKTESGFIITIEPRDEKIIQLITVFLVCDGEFTNLEDLRLRSVRSHD